ncbi:Partner of Y14 and mago [Phytophthora citrophthora]|uniref:Partner of Y14 and mago n=1 Tax=Phytophthora citrophthora TaxID=4793 RepID=A0AAD9G3W2_9STRA|nr:Partner of Y14 and mago [Phytophthora citrophthora]
MTVYTMSAKEERLPLGAVRTADGQVEVPASRRADGSTRKAIRIRQGYVPQDEVPKYKTVAQRRREQEAKRAQATKDVEDELPMDKLSLQQEPPAAKERSITPNRERGPPVKDANDTDAKADCKQQLKRQLTKINKQLKDIAKLEDAEGDSLTAQQKQKVARKSTLQQQRNEIIAELNGATVTRTSSSATGPRPKVAISL